MQENAVASVPVEGRLNCFSSMATFLIYSEYMQKSVESWISHM